MRKIWLISVSLLFTANAFAATVPTHISGATVNFNSTRANVVTFNTATSRVWIYNESLHHDVYVDFICRDSTHDNQRGFETTNTVKLIKACKIGGNVTPNTIEMDISIVNLGFISDTGSGSVTYRVTGERPL